MTHRDLDTAQTDLAQSYLALQQRLGPHTAPTGLYLQNKGLPFLGKVTCHTRQAEAGSWQEILIDYQVGAAGLADGGWFKATFKFYSDWALFQTSDPRAANYISAEYQAGPLLPGQSPATVQQLQVRFDQKGHERPFQKAVIVDVVDGYLNAGDHIILRLGDRRAGGPGTRIQSFIEDQFRFRCYVDPLGTSRFAAVPGDISFPIVAGAPSLLQLKAPRFSRPGQQFGVRLSLQDRWGNICSQQAVTVLIEVRADDATVQQLELRFPSSGWASLDLRQHLQHVTPAQRLLLKAWLPDFPEVNAVSREITYRSDFPGLRAFYADLHVHAHDTVGTNSPAYNTAYAQQVGGIDVIGYTANDFQISDENWQAGVAAIAAFNQPGEFISFPVQEWCGSSTAGGDHNVIFLAEQAPAFPYGPQGQHNRTFLWNEEMKGQAVQLGRWPVEELWDAYHSEPEQHLIIPHVGGRRYIPDWHHPELERLVEISSSWGHFPWLYQDVLSRGYKLGVCAAGDEHRGRPGGGAPGTQVFGSHGGLTGVIAEALTKPALARALRARHTWATTGDQSAVLIRSGAAIQGDEVRQAGPATVDYHFLGEAGWEELRAYDHHGEIWRRDLHRELGYSPYLLRLRWGGARIPDRYRWAEWRGQLKLRHANLLGYQSFGFEHHEEVCWRSGPNQLSFRSDTYGDADSVELRISDIAKAQIELSGQIGAYVKVGDVLQANPYLHQPDFEFHINGAELLEKGRIEFQLGGADLFIALERLSEAALPKDLSGSILLSPENADFGHRPVYFYGRQRDDNKVWSSALFFQFE